MGLSNTAVPRYYGEFREQVLRGDIVVCEEISEQMNLIDDLIRDPGVYYDEDAVKGIIDFCESELTLTDGSDLELLPTFKLWLEDLFGWYYFVDMQVFIPGKRGQPGHYENRRVKKRLRRKQYLIIARGAAKTMYAECIHAYGLVVDPETTDQITTAPTMAQAEEVLSPLRTAIARARGPVFKFLTMGSIQNTTGNRALRQKLCPTKKGIENFLTNSILRIRPMTIDKLQGARCKYVTMDEWLSCDIREDPVSAMEQSAAKGSQEYLIICTSSEGTIRNGVGDDIKMELKKILKGEYAAPHTSIWWYKLDDISEVNDPNMWIKANPNLGATVSYETYQLDVERAEHNPAARNDILAKRFDLPLEGYTYFFTYEETLVHKRRREYWQLPCSLGADLSRGDDFCAFTFIFPLSNGSYGVKTRCYISELTYHQLPGAMRHKYDDEFIEEGSLIVMEGTVLDMMKVYDDLIRFIDSRMYDIRTFGYDPYYAKDFVTRWTLEHGEYGVEKVVQGARTESVPLGELKKLAQARMLLFDQNVMQFCMGNCVVLEDTNGNRKLLKDRRDQKIDSVAAMLDAYVAAKAHPEAFE